MGWARRDDGTWGPAESTVVHDSDEPVTVSVVQVGRPHRRRGRALAVCALALAAVFAGAYALKGKSNEPTVNVRDETTVRTTSSTTEVTSTTTTLVDTTTVPVVLPPPTPSTTTTTAAPASTKRRSATTTSIDWAALAALAGGQAPPATFPDSTAPPVTDPPPTAPPATDPPTTADTAPSSD
jgi:hypothetical protein